MLNDRGRCGGQLFGESSDFHGRVGTKSKIAVPGSVGLPALAAQAILALFLGPEEEEGPGRTAH